MSFRNYFLMNILFEKPLKLKEGFLLDVLLLKVEKKS